MIAFAISGAPCLGGAVLCLFGMGKMRPIPVPEKPAALSDARNI
jgi:hypothetical protein